MTGNLWPAVCVRGGARKPTFGAIAPPAKVSLRRPRGEPGPGQERTVDKVWFNMLSGMASVAALVKTTPSVTQISRPLQLGAKLKRVSGGLREVWRVEVLIR
jgi:hypothetical protein